MTSKHPYIKLVHSSKESEQEKKPGELKVQYSMFPESNPYSLVYVTPSLLDESGFLDIFDEVHPRYVLDMRRVPRFDIGTLNREKIFNTYFSNNLTYCDLDVSNDSYSERCELIAKRFSEWLECTDSDWRKQESLVGPVVIFIDSACKNNEELFTLVSEIKDKTKTKKEWDVYSVN